MSGRVEVDRERSDCEVGSLMTCLGRLVVLKNTGADKGVDVVCGETRKKRGKRRHLREITRTVSICKERGTCVSKWRQRSELWLQQHAVEMMLGAFLLVRVSDTMRG